MKPTFIYILPLLFFLFSFTEGEATDKKKKITYKVTGIITNQTDKKPLKGVLIWAYAIQRGENGEITAYHIEKVSHFLKSDDKGKFAIDLHADTEYVIYCNLGKLITEPIWFDKKDIVDGEHISIEISMWEKSVIALKGFVYNNKNRQRLAAAFVILTDLSSGVSKKLQTQNDGTFYFLLEKGKQYQLKSKKKNYFISKNIAISTSRVVERVFTENLELEEITLGRKFIIHNFFEPRSEKISKKGEKELDNLFTLFQENKGFVAEISCHTDARGKDDYNLEISQKRAETVANYLIKKGVLSSRLNPKGYGETQLLNKCKNGVRCSTRQHEINRRIELVIIGLTE